MKSFISAILVLFFLNSCSSNPIGNSISSPSGLPTDLKSSKLSKLTVIATADFHGALESEETSSENGRKVVIGGGAIFSRYMKILRAKAAANGPVLWVDGGDLFQGSMASNRFEGVPVIRLFNHLGLQAAALGNHEFDYGPKGKKSVPRSTKDDARGALKARAKEANFPFLAVNLRDEKGEIPNWAKASIMVDLPGVRVGIIGAATPDTPSTTNIMNLGGLSFLDPMPLIQKEAELLRKNERADVIVLVMHIGGGCENNANAVVDDLKSCSITSAMDLVKQLPEGLVDVAVAGHSHRGVMKRVGSTIVMQGFSHGKYIAWAEVPLELGRKRAQPGGMAQVCLTTLVTEKIRTCEPSLVRKLKGEVEAANFMGEAISPDPEVEALLKPELEQVAKLKNQSLGIEVKELFTRSYSSESPLGNLVADLAKASAPKVDLGMSNGGGLRADLPEGILTYGKLFNVMPFDNQLAVMKVSGEQLMTLLRQGIFGTQGSYSWSKNLSALTQACEIAEVKINGKPLDSKRIYSVATSDFLATGGSGVKSANIDPKMVKIYWDSQYIQRDVIAEYLKKRKGVLSPADFYNSASPRIQREGSCAIKLDR